MKKKNNLAHSILQYSNKINHNKDNNNKIINIQPIENRENYEIIYPRKKRSERSLNIKQ